MRSDDLRRHSRWMLRTQEWDEPRARYPNVWHEGMPRHVLAFETLASRLRLGDLIAVYYPASQSHKDRSERFVGISRVAGLRRSHDPAYAWIDLETAHRFDPPFDVGEGPRRVVMCCDPGWPEPDVALFRRVHDAAVAAGWKPGPEDALDRAPGPSVAEAPSQEPRHAPAGSRAPEIDRAPSDTPPLSVTQAEPGRLFAGAACSGALRDHRDGSWLAVVELREDRLGVIRLEATGRAGLHHLLRDPDGTLMRAEGIGLGFPFGLPLPFAEKLMGGPFPDQGWWAFAKHLERTPLPDYLIALQEFRDGQGEPGRLTDEASGAPSPLRRSDPDLGSMAYHGIKMIAEERSRYAVRPFESAQGKLLLEVSPAGVVKRIRSGRGNGEGANRGALLAALTKIAPFPVVVPEPLIQKCLARPEALDAVIAARSAALAVMSGETDKTPEELGTGHGDRIRREGWIYGAA
jgi:hypothetical protein